MWPFRDPNSEIPSFVVKNTIGAGSRVRGELTGPGGFRIDGTVDGEIVADGPVVVGPEGVVNGTVRGRDVVVLGRVQGDVYATAHLEIGPQGKVLGDIKVQSFRMHKGGAFRGRSDTPGGEVAKPPALPASTGTAHTRGRTLPPPNGAVPPPAMLAEKLVTLIPELVDDEAESQQRLITPHDSDAPQRATGS